MNAPDTKPARSKGRLLPTIVLAAAAALAGVYFGLDPDKSASTTAEAESLQALQAQLKSTTVLPADFRSVPEFELVGVDGTTLDQQVLEGQWSMMFFGYTYCPDVCPITLQVMKEVVADLEGRNIEPLQVIFTTVDPVRDTAERLKEYVGFFDQDFVGITGELTDINALTRQLGIVASFTANAKNPENYLVDHTASMLLIDPQRRVRAKFSAPHEVGTIVDDYKILIDALG